MSHPMRLHRRSRDAGPQLRDRFIAPNVRGVVTGLQEGFDWGGVALAAIGGAVGGGLGPKGVFGGGGAFSNVGSGFVQGALRGAVGSVVSQGIGLATGLQRRFDWAGVAAGAVAGGVSEWIVPAGSSVSPGRQILAGTASGIAAAAARSVVTGTSFGDNVLAVLPQVIGNTIGNLVAEGVASAGRGNGKPSDLLAEVKDGPYDRTPDPIVAAGPAVGDESAYEAAAEIIVTARRELADGFYMPFGLQSSLASDQTSLYVQKIWRLSCHQSASHSSDG